MDSDAPDADVIVVGAGMAGLTVAAVAAQGGASVIVVEIGVDIGGSAALSEGYVWTAPSVEVFQQQDPDGDAERFALMLRELPASFDWLHALGVEVGGPLEKVLGFGQGRQIDVLGFLSRCRSLVESAGGWILLQTKPMRLLLEHGRVAGIVATDLRDGQTDRMSASTVVLATGGFQVDPDFREQLLYPGASGLVLRTNPHSDGGGLRLGLEAGAKLTSPTTGFYGHLVPSPLATFEPKDYAALAQYHSEHGLLLDKRGRRFTDESLGDHVNTVDLAHQPTALLVIDERIRRDEVMRPFIPGMSAVDKMAEAGRRGGRYASADTLRELAASAKMWGYDPVEMVRSIELFNDGVTSGELSRSSRSQHRHPLVEPAFAALEVQAAITFTYRGLATDLHGRVLGSGGAIPGLYAAGVDAGGLNTRGYTGGLVRGLTLGRHTGHVVVDGLTRDEVWSGHAKK